MSRRIPRDTFEGAEHSIEGPARFAEEILPAEAKLTIATRSLYVGIGGNLYCRPMGGANNTVASYQSPTGEHANVFFYNVVSGTILPIRMDAVWVRNHGDTSQNTTASQLVGLW